MLPTLLEPLCAKVYLGSFCPLHLSVTARVRIQSEGQPLSYNLAPLPNAPTRLYQKFMSASLERIDSVHPNTHQSQHGESLSKNAMLLSSQQVLLTDTPNFNILRIMTSPIRGVFSSSLAAIKILALLRCLVWLAVAATGNAF